jgi:hypothetical protein
MPRNRARCANCNDIIESKHHHDWVNCSCFKNDNPNEGIFIDGGQEYFRGGGKLENLIRIDDDGNEFPLKLRMACEHEWDEVDSDIGGNRTAVECTKCKMSGERDDDTGYTHWPAT